MAALAFLAGVVALLALPAVPGLTVQGCACVALIVCFCWRRLPAARICFWLCCGFLFAGLHAQLYLQRVWPSLWADERALAEIVVDSIPYAQGDGWVFDARVSVRKPYRVKHELKARLISRERDVRPRAGEHWRVLLTLRTPRAPVNPGAVDFERMLFHDRVHATGTIVPSRLNQRLGGRENPLDIVRERVVTRIEGVAVDRDAAALIAALAVGVTGPMSREQWRVFNATGTTHLIAISGMHVTMLAIAAFAIARWLWSIHFWRSVSWPRDVFAGALALGIAAFYALLAGFSVPTQRTLIMLASWMLIRSTARAAAPMQPFNIALFVVLLLDPFAPLAAGFWLSFGAMAAILLIVQTRVSWRGVLHESLVVQLGVSAALVPFTLACFGMLSLLGPVVNAVAIPYISWLLVPIILLALIMMPISAMASQLALDAAAWLHDFAWPWLVLVADSPFAVAYAAPPLWWYPLAVIAIVIALSPWPWGLRIAPMLCIIALATGHHAPPKSGAAEITVLDVGEGSSIVVRTAQHALVFGVGESYGTEGRRVENTLLPFLRSRGVHSVDMLVLGDASPVAGPGTAAMLAAIPVRESLFASSAAADFAGARVCAPGDTWSWDGVHFQMLDSCRLRLTTRSSELMLDAGSLSFRDSAGSPWVVLSGRGTRNGRERPQVTSLRQAGTKVLTSSDSGAVRVVADPSAGISPPRGLRSVQPAIWRAAPTYPVP